MQNLDGSCIQSVNLVIDEDPRTEVTLSHLGEVFLAGQYRVSLPYSDGMASSPRRCPVIAALHHCFVVTNAVPSADLFHIQELSSMFLQVRTAFGLRLQYGWAQFRVYLQADAPWKDDTAGLCGTFNGNIQDDFL